MTTQPTPEQLDKWREEFGVGNTHEKGICQSDIKAILQYDETNGLFTWKTGTRKAGKFAGNLITNRYVLIGIKGKLYPAHRLAWCYVYGLFPQGMIDHDNRIKTDNRLSNLRLADFSENAVNAGIRSDNESGFCGVSRDKNREKWQAKVKIRGVQKHLGRFDNLEEAVGVRDDFMKKHFGEFFNVNQNKAKQENEQVMKLAKFGAMVIRDDSNGSIDKRELLQYAILADVISPNIEATIEELLND